MPLAGLCQPRAAPVPAAIGAAHSPGVAPAGGPPRQVFLYIMPGRWYLASMVKTEFSGATFAGATPVVDPAPGQDAYTCDDPSVVTCFGLTGDQVPHAPSRRARPAPL